MMKLINIFSPQIVSIFFLFKIYSRSKFQVLLTTVSMLFTRYSGLIHLKTESLYP